MRNLPFVVQPRRQPEMVRIGTEEVGVFEIERKGYLTVGEKSAYQQIVTNKEGIKALRGLINKIAAEEKLPLPKVQESVNKLLQNEKLTKREETMLEGYSADILEVLEVFKQEALHSQLIMATVLLMSRVDSDWRFEDTAELDVVVLEQLAELFENEERKCLDALSFTFKPEEDEVGKD